ncbi:MAG TPA: bifunctional DNA-binding transcriptional regulator/O6-methylguanine-DNA methyltransferase Ada [Pyrinomonadaceae bacterium]
MKKQMDLLLDDNASQWDAVLSKDSSYDGQFVFAVSSTGVYCRPSCPSRRANRQNVSFFELPEAAERAGYRACLRCRPKEARAQNNHLQMVQRVCRIIEDSDGEPVTLARLGQEVGVSPFHLQRTFKSVMGITPSQFAEECRIRKFRKSVRAGGAITEAIYEAGYGSSSRVYEGAASQLGMTPATYGKGGRGAMINYSVVDCHLGHLLVAATEKGVCSVKLGDSAEQLASDLATEFPAARITCNAEGLVDSVNAVVNYLSHKVPHIDLPLDIQATAFQRQVWEQLRAIPYGETYSYTQLAKAIGQEKAVRAVARACATNPVALVIPCHRVIRQNSTLGGYRWGLERKKQLLIDEKKHANQV